MQAQKDDQQVNLYRIINPSDRVLLQSDDETLVAVTVCVLTNGQYGLDRCSDGTIVLPVMMSEPELVAWLAARGVPSLGEYLHANWARMADICESVFYGDASDYAALTAATQGMAPDLALAARSRYNDTKRSSMNDIGALFLENAKRIREFLAKPK